MQGLNMPLSTGPAVGSVVRSDAAPPPAELVTEMEGRIMTGNLLLSAGLTVGAARNDAANTSDGHKCHRCTW